LADQFGVGRSVVREALLKLEFFGILKTRPQSGTTVEDMTSTGLSALISNMLSLADPKPADMVEARRILEVETARLAAERADRAAIAAIRAAHESHVASVTNGEVSIESDVLFHLQIAEAAGNDVLHSMVSVFAPRIISSAKESRTCEDGRAVRAEEVHAVSPRTHERCDPDVSRPATLHTP